MSTLPEQMQDLPVDERRKLPIPVMNTFDDRHDFTAINGRWIHEHPRDCGICGKPLGYWLAFVGGPASTTNRMFLDPAMHEECAAAAMTMCPHMAIWRHTRAPEHRVHEDAITPDGFVEDKPERLFISITRDFKVQPVGGAMAFKIAPPKRVREYRYVDNVLTEV